MTFNPAITASIIPFPRQEEGHYHHCGLSIDLQALQHNFKTLQSLLGSSLCSAVVKANAYGLGIGPCARALYDVGCRHFFTAYLEEAIELKKNLLGYAPSDIKNHETKIYVLNGFMKGQEEEFLAHGFIPVLTDIEKVERWASFSKQNPLPTVLHLDTGMNRTGLRFDRLSHSVLENSLSKLDIQIVMSHLACSDDKNNPLNELQRKRFTKAVQELKLPSKPQLSLANSRGICLLGPDYYYDMVRPGMALYGCATSYNKGLKSTLRLWARIYQIQTVPQNESIGYAQSYFTQSDRKIATVTLGYADGFAWNLGAAGHEPFVMIGAYKAPIVGRVSMDLITIDVTDVPSEYIYEGAIVDILNETISVNDLAKWASTLPYEIMLKLGGRLHRHYHEGE